MGQRYSPEDAWPDHPSKAWRETLTFARQHGWTLHTVDGHTWGNIACPGGVCKKKVFSSGRGGESVAKDTLTKVGRCRHGEPAIDPLVKIADHISQAEKLLLACEALQEQGRLEGRLDLLEEATESVEAVWDEVGELVQLVDEAEAETEEALRAAGLESGTYAEALDGATEHVSAADRSLEDQPKRDPRVRKLRSRVAQCRTRIEILNLGQVGAQ